MFTSGQVRTANIMKINSSTGMDSKAVFIIDQEWLNDDLNSKQNLDVLICI